jgi:hypothetical protein
MVGPVRKRGDNIAFAQLQDGSGKLETACVGISQLAPGVYFYRTKVGDYTFPLNQFGVLR